MPNIPDVICIKNVNVYTCLNDNRGVGEMVGSWVGIGGVCCEVGASEMAEAWGRSLEKMEALAWRVLSQSGAGKDTGFEMWDRRERICLTRDWRNLFWGLEGLTELISHDCSSPIPCTWLHATVIFAHGNVVALFSAPPSSPCLFTCPYSMIYPMESYN